MCGPQEVPMALRASAGAWFPGWPDPSGASRPSSAASDQACYEHVAPRRVVRTAGFGQQPISKRHSLCDSCSTLFPSDIIWGHCPVCKATVTGPQRVLPAGVSNPAHTKVRSTWPIAQQRRPVAKLRGQGGQGKQTQLGSPSISTHAVVLPSSQWVGGSENWQEGAGCHGLGQESLPGFPCRAHGHTSANRAREGPAYPSEVHRDCLSEARLVRSCNPPDRAEREGTGRGGLIP